MNKTLLVLFAAGAVFGTDLPHIGYVYPAGGIPGTTFTVTVGGQFLKDTLAVHVSGGGVSAEIEEYTYELDPRARNRIKNNMEKMEAALKEETDSDIREQIQYQLDLSEGQMQMVKRQLFN